MYISNIVKRIRMERIRQNISLADLGRGIYSESMLHRIEMGYQEAEWFVLDCLWQRLGQSAEDFSVILPSDEYDLWKRRQDIANAVDSGQFNQAYDLIKDCQDAVQGRNKLHTQLLGYYQLLLWERQDFAGGKLQEVNRGLLKITQCPRFIEDSSRYCFGQTELMLYLQSGRIFERMGKMDEAERCFLGVVNYLEKRNYDIRLRKWIYPQAAYHLACIWFGRKDYRAAEDMTKKTVDLLRSTQGTVLFLPKLFFLASACREKMFGSDGRTRQYDLFGDELRQFLNSVDPFCEDSDEHPSYRECEAEEFCTVLRTRRICMGISQEQIADGICSPVTLSRLEQRKNAPRKNVREKLLNRLGLSGESYDSFFFPEQTEACRVFEKMKRYLDTGQPESANECLERLETTLDLHKAANRQIIELFQSYIDRRKNNRRGNVWIEELKRILCHSLGEWKADRSGTCYIPLVEYVIWMSIAEEYYRMGKYEPACEIVEKIRKEGINSAKQAHQAVVLVSCKRRCGMYHQSHEVLNQAIHSAVKAKGNYYMGYLLFAEACMIEEEREKGDVESEKRYRMCYLLFRFFRNGYGIQTLAEYWNKNNLCFKHIEEEFEKID